MPPIELESGYMQLTDDEIRLFASAAALLAKARREHIILHEPMMRDRFVMLYLAHCVVTDDMEFLDEITAVIEEELVRRRYPH